ncbi:MAG: hypothetical protein JXR60_07915 [Bacteroidales bacterium]|nr:hypothetical protein [Bacteroidales bacterium]
MKKEWVSSIVFLIVAIIAKLLDSFPTIIVHLAYLISLLFIVIDYKNDYMWLINKGFTIITMMYKSIVLGAIFFSALNYPGKFWIQGYALALSVFYALYLHFGRNNTKAAAEVFFYNSIGMNIAFIGI